MIIKNAFCPSKIVFMRQVTFIFILSILLLYAGCSTFRQLEQLSEKADTAYQEDRKKEALELYEQLIELHEEREEKVDGELFYRTGMLAYELGDTSKVIEYLELAKLKSEVDSASIVALAKSYREIDNLSLEINHLEKYVERYPEGDRIAEMKERYFETLVESKNWEQAAELWPELEGDPYQDEELTEDYFVVNKALDNEEKANEVAKKILELNAYNEKALDWLARKYYYQAAEVYKREMDKYREHRSYQQYAHLKDIWDDIHDDFRTAKTFFERLYEMNPTSEYAGFLADIYERLGNEQQSRYYRQRAND